VTAPDIQIAIKISGELIEGRQHRSNRARLVHEAIYNLVFFTETWRDKLAH